MIFWGGQQFGQIFYRESSRFRSRGCNRHSGYDCGTSNAHRSFWGSVNWNSTDYKVRSWGLIEVVNSTTTCYGSHLWNCSVIVTIRTWCSWKALRGQLRYGNSWHWTSSCWKWPGWQVRQNMIGWHGRTWGWLRCGYFLSHQWHSVKICCFWLQLSGFRLHGELGIFYWWLNRISRIGNNNE